MSFDVVVQQIIPVDDLVSTGGGVQKQEAGKAQTVRTEMSTDSLQLKLIKDIESVISINGQRLTGAQKETVRLVGKRWEVTDLEGVESGAVRITARREGHTRTWDIDTMGVGRFADGHGQVVPVSRQDPLNRSPWGDGLADEGT